MTRLSVLILVALSLCLMSSSRVESLATGKCIPSPLPVIPDFDLDKYVGRWYTIQRFKYFFDPTECSQAHYRKLNDTRIEVINSGVDKTGKKPTSITGSAQLKNVTKPNQFDLRLPIVVLNTTLYMAQGEYNVLDTDYVTYSVVYSCSPSFIPGLKSEQAFVLSRTPTIDYSLFKRLRNNLASAGATVSQFQVVNQTNAFCGY